MSPRKKGNTKEKAVEGGATSALEQPQVDPLGTLTVQEFNLVIGEQQMELYRLRRNERILLAKIQELTTPVADKDPDPEEKAAE